MRGLARLISSAISNWAKTGPLTKRKLRLPAGALFQHFGAEDVGRHQVGRELDAPCIEPEHDAERFDQLGLGEARHADEQAVAAGEERDESLLDDLLLAENDGSDGRLRRRDVHCARFCGAHDNIFDPV